MMSLFVLFSFVFQSAEAVTLDAEDVAQAMVTLIDQTVQNLDRHRIRHLNGNLSSVELSMLTAAEHAKFETSAFRVFKDTYIDREKTIKEFRRDPVLRDVRHGFRSYLARKTSLEALMRSLIHERFTVEAFVQDPELGYGAFHGFTRNPR